MKERLRRFRVFRALSNKKQYPESLPNPELSQMGNRDYRVVDNLQSVCMFLGPYRNLTTLTGSFLFLHPEIHYRSLYTYTTSIFGSVLNLY